MKKILVFLMLVLFTVSCSDSFGKDEDEIILPTLPPHFPTPDNLQAYRACIERGGKWVILGSMGEPDCISPTTDGGNKCANSFQCQSICIARGQNVQSLPPELPFPDLVTPDPATKEILYGTCSEWTVNFGCVTQVEDGRIVVACRD